MLYVLYTILDPNVNTNLICYILYVLYTILGYNEIIVSYITVSACLKKIHVSPETRPVSQKNTHLTKKLSFYGSNIH